MNKSMTLTEAKEVMNNGVKITHESFTSYEYMHLIDGKTYFEDGVAVPYGWLDKEQLQIGWSIFKENK